ncbi:hypothetical protein [Deinococcus sp.]|uniref:hypothetical protein n=1 Tax=Deinococcus sp. TaxID=47478 RepID=UPI0025C13F6C|nr:hypothetical protein [Deinococcus sp.]
MTFCVRPASPTDAPSIAFHRCPAKADTPTSISGPTSAGKGWRGVRWSACWTSARRVA